MSNLCRFRVYDVDTLFHNVEVMVHSRMPRLKTFQIKDSFFVEQCIEATLSYAPIWKRISPFLLLIFCSIKLSYWKKCSFFSDHAFYFPSSFHQLDLMHLMSKNKSLCLQHNRLFYIFEPKNLKSFLYSTLQNWTKGSKLSVCWAFRSISIK